MSLPKSKYKILSAIVAQMSSCKDGLVKVEPIAAACGYSPQVVWQNFGFFTSAGIFSSGMNKYLSEEGHLLSHALCSGDSKQVIICWRAILDTWPPMLRLLSWLRKNNGLEIPAAMWGMEALFAGDLSSSRFSRNCLIQVARRIGYVQMVDKKFFISDYSESLADSEIHRGSGPSKNLPRNDTPLFEETDQNPAYSAKNAQNGGIHIHLHFDSKINSAQIASIFQSLGEAILTPPDASTTAANPPHPNTISLLRPNF